MEDELRHHLQIYLEKPGFARLWPRVREKLERLGHVGGRVKLDDLDAAERRAIAELLSINLHGRHDVTVDLRRLDEALLETRFGISLVDCMEFLYPGRFISVRQQREAEATAWLGFCEWARSVVRKQSESIADEGNFSHRIVAWIDDLAQGKGVGYRAFRECYDQFQSTGASAVWVNVTRALLALQDLQRTGGKAVRIPIFAASVTGDAHGLDRNTQTGRLFYWGLVTLDRADGAVEDLSEFVTSQIEEGGQTGANRVDEDSESVRLRYLRFGLLPDDISSIVWVAGFSGVFGFTEMPAALPLWYIDHLKFTEAPSETSSETPSEASSEAIAQALPRVYVVENPSIFGAIMDEAETTAGVPFLPHPIVCPSGQPSVAALRLLDKLVARGSTIYYSGDFDVNGLLIASLLRLRYGECFVPWRMSTRDYLWCCQGNKGLQPFSESERRRLAVMELPWGGRDLPKTMATQGVKVFQEHLVDQLCHDYWGNTSEA